MENKILLVLLILLTGCNVNNNSEISSMNSTNNSLSNLNTSTSSDLINSSIVSSSSDVSSNISSPEVVTENSALDMLKASPFSNYINTEEDLGLSEMSNVGVDKNRFENEILYPVPEEGTIYIAEDYGISQDNETNTGTINLFLQSLKTVEGNKIIKFKKGIYYFSGSIDFTGINDLYFVGEDGTEFVNTGWSSYFEARASKNIHINNITFDMKNSPSISGTVKSINETDTQSKVVLDIPEEFNLNNNLYYSWEGTTCSYMECYYDELTGAYVPDRSGNLFYNSPTSSSSKGVADAVYNNVSRELTITLNKSFPYCSYSTPQIGTNVSFAYTMYENHGIYFFQCENVYLENVNVHVSGGMGFRVDEGKNVYLNRVNYMNRDGSKRIMTCTADIVHTASLEGDLVITNSILEASHDDALNIKTFYTKVTSVNASAKEIEVTQTQNEVTINFEIGDTIEVYSIEKMGLVDTYTIKDLIKSGKSYILTVDKRPRNVEIGQNVGNATKATKLTLDNCIIRNKRNRGILLQARNSVISNCTFQNVVMGAIQVLSVYDVFREAIVPKNIRLINNKFINNWDDIHVFAYGSEGSEYSVPSTIENVDIINNYFYNGVGTNVNLLAVGNTKVSNNLFEYDEKNTGELIKVRNSSDVTVKDNLAYIRFNGNIDFIIKNDKVTNLIVDNNLTKKGD